MKQDGSSIECADKSLKADREIVLAAVKQDGYVLKYASKEWDVGNEIAG